MLNAHEMDVVLRAAHALRAHHETALASQLDALALAASAHKAATARRPKAGRPSRTYTVELAPGWVQHVAGPTAAHALVASTLASLGQRGAPSAGSLAVTLSRNGHWLRTLETANGVATLSVRPLVAPTGQIPADAPSGDAAQNRHS